MTTTMMKKKLNQKILEIKDDSDDDDDISFDPDTSMQSNNREHVADINIGKCYMARCLCD
jgi:hypothetical protein